MPPRISRPAVPSERAVTLFFQRWPGTDPASGIENLAYRVLRGGRPSQPRTTNTRGEINVPLGLSQTAKVQLVDPDSPSTIWSEYEVGRRIGLPDMAAYPIRGSRCRLNMLGYNAGMEGIDGMDIFLERAILNFQADNGLPIEGVLRRIALSEPARDLTDVRIPADTKTKLDEVMRSINGTLASAIAPPDSTAGPGFKRVLRSERLVLVRFSRAIPGGLLDTRGQPTDGEFPPIDDRGFGLMGRFPEVGMMEGTSIYVGLVREDLDNQAPLFVTSSHPEIVGVTSGRLPAESPINLRLLRAAGGGPYQIHIRVHLGSPEGPIIHELGVNVLPKIELNVAIHLVKITIESQDGTHDRDANEDLPQTREERDRAIIATLDSVSKFWQQAGVQFRLARVREIDDRSSRSRALYTTRTDFFEGSDDFRDVKHLLRTLHIPDEINLYIVKGMPRLAGTTMALGFGPQIYSDPQFSSDDIHPRGVIVKTRVFNEPYPKALAHELGHYLGLEHPDEEDNMRVSSWALRRMMFAAVSDFPRAPWQIDDFGNTGSAYLPGSLLTIKDLLNPTEEGFRGDNELLRVRVRVSARERVSGLLYDGPYDGVDIRQQQLPSDATRLSRL